MNVWRGFTGFTGSAGVAVVLTEQAALFVTGASTVQARQQVSDEHFIHLHLIRDPFLDWLAQQLPAGSRGIDASRTAWNGTAKRSSN